MDITHSQARSSQEHSISCIDWDEISGCIECNIKRTLPDGGVTRHMIQEELGCSESSAKRAMAKLVKNGWEKGYYNCGVGRASYVVKP